MDMHVRTYVSGIFILSGKPLAIGYYKGSHKIKQKTVQNETI